MFKFNIRILFVCIEKANYSIHRTDYNTKKHVREYMNKSESNAKQNYLIFSIIQNVILIIFCICSTASYNYILLPIILLSICIGSVCISYVLYAWKYKNMRFYETFNLSFGLSASISLLGYLFASLYPILL